MTVRTPWLSFMTTAVVIGVPVWAAAQLPSSFQTPGNKGKANEAQVCAADFEASAKPIAKWPSSSSCISWSATRPTS